MLSECLQSLKAYAEETAVTDPELMYYVVLG